LVASRRTAVGFAGCAPRFVPNRGHPALTPDAFGPGGPARSACTKASVCIGRVWAVLLFPSPYHGVLAVKGFGPMALASWRPSYAP